MAGRPILRQAMSAIVICAPHEIPLNAPLPWIFTAGSIEMGKAEDWQSRLIADLADETCTILNPRRPDWDSSWVQEKTNPQFRQQVKWELDALDRSWIVAMYLVPGTMSPISLLELGLHARDSGLVVCCPPGFWRKGNVDITCERYLVPVYESYEPWLAAIKRAISSGYKAERDRALRPL